MGPATMAINYNKNNSNELAKGEEDGKERIRKCVKNCSVIFFKSLKLGRLKYSQHSVFKKNQTQLKKEINKF